MTLTFLIAYLFYNDGIQTVIYSAAVYGSEELKFGQSVLIAHHPADPVRGVRRSPVLRPAGRRSTAPTAPSCGAPSRGWSSSCPRCSFPSKNLPLFLARRRGDRHRARRHPGALPLVLQPAHPPRPRGRVLRALQRLRARHVVVRRPAVRRGLPGHRLLPARHRLADHLLRARRDLPAPASTRSAGSPRPGTRYRPRSRNRSRTGRPARKPGSGLHRRCQARLGELREEYGNLGGLGTVNSSDGNLSTVSQANL